jgi:hypothetical protein
MIKRLFRAGAVLGVVLPYAYFVPFLLTSGPDVGLFFRQLFASHISAFFGVDVIVSALVLWVFVFAEGRRLGMRCGTCGSMWSARWWWGCRCRCFSMRARGIECKRDDGPLTNIPHRGILKVI